MPTSNQIANLIIEKGLPLEAVKEVLIKHNSLAMWNIVLKKLKCKLELLDPKNVLEIATDLSYDTIKSIKSKIYDEGSDVQVVLNPKLLAGFKAKKKYKSIDASALRIINQIRN